MPNALAGAVSVRPQAAGTASGITGFLQMGLGAPAAQIAGHLLANAASALPMVLLMLALTLFSQFWIIPRMDTLRAQVGDFASVPLTDPARVQFDALHVWSTRLEGAVLLLGLAVVYLTATIPGQR